MSASKHIDRICVAAVVCSLLLTLLFMNGGTLGVQAASRTAGYEGRLFDTSRVHTLDIVMDDWDSFIETCENEEYAACAVVIDGEAYKNTGIRAKGNTSLSNVSQMGSDRYSFKLEFDHYDSGRSYYGLDKLCLNNLIQDNTFMKDYLTYRMMARFGVASPLCSYVYITVNGEDWGLYLAVEGVEETFLQRNYGRDYGELYKPDSMSFGGGRGNGRDFDMDDFISKNSSDQDGGQSGTTQNGGQSGTTQDGGQSGNMQPPAGFDPSSMNGTPPAGFGPSSAGGTPAESSDPSQKFGGGNRGGGFGGGGMFGGFGMGSDDVKLKYTDDDPDSYSNIFDSAKTNVSSKDKARLIQALKILSEGGDVSGAVDTDAVLRYFAVHNFVVNSDSYTGAMVHNYYLYEEDGLLSMIPWDYNLAFGTFQGGDASGAVNDPIDSPLSVSGNGDRPMADWLFSSEENTRLYHQYLQELLDTVDPVALIEQTAALIDSYVERDPSKFCTYEEFETGTEALKTFCGLRIESVSGQLAGTIPSTTADQRADSSALVDTAGLDLSDMGTMGGGMGGGGRGGFPQQGGSIAQSGSSFPQQGSGLPQQEDSGSVQQTAWTMQQSGSFQPPDGNFPQPGEGFAPPDGNFPQPGEGFAPPDNSFPTENSGTSGQAPAEGMPTQTGGTDPASSTSQQPADIGSSDPGQGGGEEPSQSASQPAQDIGTSGQGQGGENDASPSGSQPQGNFDTSNSGQNGGGDRQPPGGVGFPGGGIPEGGSQTQTTGAAVLLAVSILVLAVGLVIAFKFRGR